MLSDLMVASLNLNSASNQEKKDFPFASFSIKDKEDLGTCSNESNAVDWQREWEGTMMKSQNIFMAANLAVLCFFHCRHKNIDSQACKTYELHECNLQSYPAGMSQLHRLYLHLTVQLLTF